MKKRLMDYIHCPECNGELELIIDEQVNGEIISGKITCSSCNNYYPIIDAIPRFIDKIKTADDLRKVYADSFGHQWTTYNWERDVDEYEFFTITDLNKDDLKDKVVLDVGCGGGRFSRFVCNYSKEFIGFDYSIAVNKAYELCKDNPNAHFLQCDVHKHPMKPDMFDFVYSHGVIHHTVDTKKAFDKLPQLVKKGGKLYIAIFRKAFALLRFSDNLWRFALNKLPYPILDKICGILSYFAYIPFPVFFKRFFWFSLQKTHEQRKCCLFDWYGPVYHHEHTAKEVLEWFKNAGFKNNKYINAWPYCPDKIKYSVPGFLQSFRLGQLLGVIGEKL